MLNVVSSLKSLVFVLARAFRALTLRGDRQTMFVGRERDFVWEKIGSLWENWSGYAKKRMFMEGGGLCEEEVSEKELRVVMR